MTEQTNAELIAEARTHVTDEYITPDTSAEESLIRRLAAALEAADQRADLADADLDVELYKNAAYRAKNDQLAAVVEKVRKRAEHIRRDYAVLPRHEADDVDRGMSLAAGVILRDVEATAPADALREHDAALIEGLAEESGYSLVYHEEAEAFLRREARQRREERA